MKHILLRSVSLVLGTLVAAQLYAGPIEGIREESSVGFDFAYYPGDQKGYGVSDGAFAPISYDVIEGSGATGERDLGSSVGGVELKGYYTHRWIIPALRWSSGALAGGNNVTVQSTTGLSPISVTQQLRLTVTPVALFQVTGGATAGTGWNAQIFDGLGSVDPVTGEVDDASFEGVVFQAFAGATVQFDLAAVVPGEWNHVVAVWSPEWTFQSLSGIGENDAWSFEADGGDNYRGWTQENTLFLGYQPPDMALKTTGLLLETKKMVGASVDRGEALAPVDWDPGFRSVQLAVVLNFGFGEGHSLTVLPQLSRERLATDETIFNAAVQSRETVGAYQDFYRVAVSYRRAL